MFEFIVNILASVGLTLIITESFLFEPVRSKISKSSEKIGYLFGCPMCMGVWMGACVGWVYGADIFKSAMLTSLLSLIIMSVINLLSYLSDFLFSKMEEVNLSDE